MVAQLAGENEILLCLYLDPSVLPFVVMSHASWPNQVVGATEDGFFCEKMVKALSCEIGPAQPLHLVPKS